MICPESTASAIKPNLDLADNVFGFFRYSPHDLPQYPTCKHNTRAFRCQTLKMAQIKKFHAAFYESKEKYVQDNFILSHAISKPVKRRRQTTGQKKERLFSTKYFVRDFDTLNTIPVCKESFKNILGIKDSRIDNINNAGFETGKVKQEKRGGDTKSRKYLPRKEAVVKFITSLQCVESHYCRGRSQRKYLSSQLTINKLFRMYDSQSDASVKVKQSYFRHIFNTNFNLGFGHPRTDMCSVCIELSERIRSEKDKDKQQILAIEKRVHKLRAKAFYSFLRDTSQHLTIISFDCQKNLCLPKVQDQEAYYLRQLYLYNFTVVKGHSKSNLNKENCFSYCWTEDKYEKSSNEIASFLLNFLLQTDFHDNTTTVRLVADGCGGQNKNRMILVMCCFWLLKNAPENVKLVELLFPVRGHSFIPPDRVFGNIERDLRRYEVIENPEQYLDVIEDHATVVDVAKDCAMFDWRDEVKTKIKDTSKLHFKISRCKRFFLKRSGKNKAEVLVKGEEFYRNELSSFKCITVTGKTIGDINPSIILPGNKVKQAKLKDVERLLKVHYGEKWGDNEKLSYYRDVLSHPMQPDDENQEVEEPMCEPMLESTELRV